MLAFSFGFDYAEVKEGMSIDIPVIKHGAEPGSVYVCTSSGTGINGATELDYEPFKKLLYFSAGQTLRFVKVVAKLDYFDEPDEFFRVQLLAVQSNTIGTPNILKIKVINMPEKTK